jgi:hypothetical protein
MREAGTKFCEIQTRKIELHYTDDEKVVTSFDVANDLIAPPYRRLANGHVVLAPP